MKVHGVLLSAGESDRFKGDKLFTEVKNKPLILYPIETFLNSGNIDTLAIVCNKINKDKIKQLLLKIETNIEIDFILGGKSRQESELKALEKLKEKNVNEEDLIVIHDSARAFLPVRLLLNLIEHAKQNQSAAPYMRTLLVSKDLSEYINENIVEIQTPQIFNFKTLSKAYINTSDNNFDSVDTTERVSQETGLEASLIEGSNLNKKITFKEDLDKIQVLLEVEN